MSKLSKEQEKAVVKVVKQNVAEAMQDIQLQLDMLWLNTVRKQFHLGPKRLRRIYEDYFRERDEFIEFYQSDGFDGMVEYAAQLELEGVECDVPAWYQEFGKTRVDYRISKNGGKQ